MFAGAYRDRPWREGTRALTPGAGAGAFPALRAGGREHRWAAAQAPSYRRSGWSSWSCPPPGDSRRSAPGGAPTPPGRPRRAPHRGNRKVRGRFFCSSIRFILSKILVHFLAQLQTGAQQSRFHRGHRQAEQLRRFFGRNLFDVAQQENNAESGLELADDFRENAMEFGLDVPLFRRGAPVFNLPRHHVVFGLHRFVERDLIGPALAQFHQRFVHSDAHQPSVEARIALKVAEVLEGFQEGVLHHVFGVFSVLRDVLGQAENPALVTVDQLLKGGGVARLGRGYQRPFVVASDRRGQRFRMGSVQASLSAGAGVPVHCCAAPEGSILSPALADPHLRCLIGRSAALRGCRKLRERAQRPAAQPNRNGPGAASRRMSTPGGSWRLEGREGASERALTTAAGCVIYRTNVRLSQRVANRIQQPPRFPGQAAAYPAPRRPGLLRKGLSGRLDPRYQPVERRIALRPLLLFRKQAETALSHSNKCIYKYPEAPRATPCGAR